MTTWAYYNEIDLDCAGALAALMEDGQIAPGYIDTRSIKDIQPDDLEGFTQVHLFAGVGVWSYAARLAGWPDDKPFWSASCPCQGESLAGKRLGADDPRHLWPDCFRLIRARRPALVVGEQVAAAAGTHWLDRVWTDLEDDDYAFRAVDIPALAVDAPHIRNRLAWIAVGNADDDRRRGTRISARRPNRETATDLAGADGRTAGTAGSTVGQMADRDEPVIRSIAPAGEFALAQQDARDHGGRDGDMADAERGERDWRPDIAGRGQEGRSTPRGASEGRATVAQGDGESGERGTGFREEGSQRDGREPADAIGIDGVTLGDAERAGLERFGRHGDGIGRQIAPRSTAAADGERDVADAVRDGHISSAGSDDSAEETPFGNHRNPSRPSLGIGIHDRRNGTFWSGAEWLLCHDGKARRTEPGIRLLSHGPDAGILSGLRVGDGASATEKALAEILAHKPPSLRIPLWRAAGNTICAPLFAEVLAAYSETEGEPL